MTTKVYPDKTFVGSLTGYYDQDSLVLITSLTDGETAGTETQYYLDNGVLKRVYKMAAQFDHNEAWAEYFSKHKSASNCYTCHATPNCTVTVTSINVDASVEIIENGKPQKITQDEKSKILSETLMTIKELKGLLKELE